MSTTSTTSRGCPLATPQGNSFRSSMVADVKLENTIVVVGREQMRRRLIVQTNVRGRDMVGFVKEAQAKVAALDLPKRSRWSGAVSSRTSTARRHASRCSFRSRSRSSR